VGELTPPSSDGRGVSFKNQLAMRTVLSLFDFTGNWSYPYLEAGWNVVRIDKGLKQSDGFSAFDIDISDITADWLYQNIFDNHETVDGILAAPPCTDFAVSGARHWKSKDKTEINLFGEFNRLEVFKEYVYQVLRIIDLCEPDFYAIENPVGRIASLIPELEKPWFFQPYWYGDAYSKKTGLYGEFNKPEPTNVVAPVMGKHGSKTQSLGGKSAKTKYLRSITPMGFARAFYSVNH
jgi:hypothetical protein